jgi:cell division protein FtsL
VKTLRKPSVFGFSLVEKVVILALLVALIVVGLLVYRHDHKNSSQNNIHVQHLEGSSHTRLTVIRDNTDNQPGVSNLNKVVSNASAIRILQDIDRLSLKPMPSAGILNCPEDDGIDFTFKFTNPNLTTTASATGCSWISVSSSYAYWTDARFWNDVSMAIGQSYDPLVGK